MSQPQNTNSLWVGGCLAFIGASICCACWALIERSEGLNTANWLRETLHETQGEYNACLQELADAKADQVRISAGWSDLYKTTCDRAAENLDRAWKAEKALKECEAKQQTPAPVLVPVQNPPTPKK